MAFNISVKDDKIILKLSGNVDLSETNDIKVAIAEEPKAGFKHLAINGEGLEYIDSSGVALMLFTKKLATEQNLIFEVEALSENAQKVINLAGLGSILKVKNTAKAETVSNSPKSADQSLDFTLDNLFDDPVESVKDTDSIKINPGSF